MSTDESRNRTDDELDEIVVDFIERFNLGESINPESILAAHPRLGPEILEQLRAFLEIDSAGPRAETMLRQLGEYRLVRELGRGGMGVVYEAWQESMDRPVALKVLPSGAADGRNLRRFLREARAAGKLRHENIVPVYCMGMAEGVPYYSMEFVDGETLGQALLRLGATEDRERTEAEERETLRALLALFPSDAEQLASSAMSLQDLRVQYAREVARAFTGAALGLQHAHEEGIVHRDLKPANLILDERGRLRILDFGLARLDGLESLTLSGLVGTPLYMSPEQARGTDCQVDRRSDIYSLGATLYYALAWKPPLAGRGTEETLRHVRESDPAPWEPRAPRELETIVFTCLAKRPEDRYASAADLASDLRAFLGGQPIQARPEALWRKVSRRMVRNRQRIALCSLAVALLALLPFLSDFGAREGSAVEFLWDVPAENTLTDISRDGRFALFRDWPDADLVLRDLKAGEDRAIFDKQGYLGGGGAIEEAVLSPEAEQIAYCWWWRTAEDERRADLRAVDSDGANVRVLLADTYARLFDWSPEGDWILAQLEGEQKVEGEMRRYPVVLVSAHGDQEVVFITETETSGGTYSPDGLSLALTARTRKNWDVHFFDLQAWREIPFLTSPSNELAAGFSPDGLSLVFTDDQLDSGDLFAVGIDETGPRGNARLVRKKIEGRRISLDAKGSVFYQVDAPSYDVFLAPFDSRGGVDLSAARRLATRQRGRIQGAVWAPAGERLAYFVGDSPSQSFVATNWDIAVYDLRTGRERILQHAPLFEKLAGGRALGWFPGGESLLVSGPSRIWRLSADTSESELLYSDGGASTLRGDVAPDGKTIFFCGARTPLYRLDPGRREPIPITSEFPRSWPAVSPDGEWVAFVREPRTICRVDSRGDREPEILLEWNDEESPGFHVKSWIRGGSHLLFSKGQDELWLLDVESREATRVLETGERILRGSSVSPHGDRMAVSLLKPHSQLWVMRGFLGGD